MNTEERIKKQRELIEKIGLYFDKEGFQPIAGRILGLLMVMDKEQFTFDEIVEELQISKSSASNALKNLEIREDIEYITQPGDRKRYFQIRKQDKFNLIKTFEKKMRHTMEMFDCILSLKADKNSSNAVFLSEMKNTLEFVLTQLNKLIEESESK
ncbi:MAG: GbsR/MarR family transcriptional regulator [Salinivirgaceae bacterium]|jgi:DNA-binding transcriptional regulator GbsR (MarR family)